jgi:hypothetical protein
VFDGRQGRCAGKGQDRAFFEDKSERARFNERRFRHIASHETVNACFVLDVVRKNNTYAGIQKLGFTSWSPAGDGVQLSLARTPDAGYVATLGKMAGGLRGTSSSWGAGVAAPKEHTQEEIIAIRSGDADLAKCVFESAEEAKMREYRTDPMRIRRNELADDYRRRLTESLSTSTVPRDWIMSVLIGAPGKDYPARFTNGRTLAVRAAAAVPNDALAQWVALYETASPINDGIVADRDVYWLRLQHLEPENSAVWMSALDSAVKRGEEFAVDATLARMASAKRYDGRHPDIVKAKVDAYLRMTPPNEYFVVASKLDSGITKQNDPYHFAQGYDTGIRVTQSGANELYSVCRTASANKNSVRMDACAKIGRLMIERGSDTWANSAGEQLLHDTGLFNDDDIEKARVRAWISQQYFETYRALFYDMPAEEAKVQIADWCETGSEYEMQRRALARAGRVLQPPAGWGEGSGPYRDLPMQASKRKIH